MMMIDAVIPCYRAAATLRRAVESAVRQPEIRRVYVVDDASDDDTWQWVCELAREYPQVCAERLPDNGGVARARNWGALQSDAEVIAFLDADDEYQDGALAAAAFALQQLPHLGLIRLRLRLRLRLQAVGLPERYAQHPRLSEAWRIVQMTVGGNTVFRRRFFSGLRRFSARCAVPHFGRRRRRIGHRHRAKQRGGDFI